MLGLTCDFAVALGPLTRSDAKEKGQEEAGGQEGSGWAITQMDPSLNFSYTLERSPLSYSKKVEGVIEPDSIQNILQGILLIRVSLSANKFCGLDVKPPLEQLPIAQLQHNLERVLFK